MEVHGKILFLGERFTKNKYNRGGSQGRPKRILGKIEGEVFLRERGLSPNAHYAIQRKLHLIHLSANL